MIEPDNLESPDYIYIQKIVKEKPSDEEGIMIYFHDTGIGRRLRSSRTSLLVATRPRDQQVITRAATPDFTLFLSMDARTCETKVELFGCEFFIIFLNIK